MMLPAAATLLALTWFSPLGGQEPETGTGAPPAVAEAEQAPESEPAPETWPIRAELPVGEERGGGTVKVLTRSLSRDGDVAILGGGAELRYEDVIVRAREIRFDSATEDLEATGDVEFEQGPRRLAGSVLRLNLDTKLGSMEQVRGSLTDEYYFWGALVEKTGEDTYLIEQGTFTSCSADPPPWSFRFKRVRLRVDGFAKARSARFRAGKAPLIYLPYVMWPAREARTSGLLVPKPGYSSRRGASLGLAYFQTLGRSWDTTFEVDLFFGGAPEGAVGSGNYLGVGNELRWRPSESSRGRFEGYVIRDPELDRDRWRFDLEHESRELPFGFRGVVSIEDASDFDFFRDFERRGDRNSIRQLYSRGYLTKNWSAHSLNVLFDRRQTFVSSDRTIELRQLPEIEYKLRSTRLGKSPLYLQIESSAHLLDVERSERLIETYPRADLLPTLTLPIRSKPWLSFSLTAGTRFTWWGDSLLLSSERAALASESDFRGESLSRFAPTASAEIVGPSFSRIFDAGGKHFSKLKHVIEPRFTYGFVDEFDDERRIPLFDEIDRVVGRNTGRVALVNRLLAKPADEESGGAREILSLELFRDVSFDPERPLQFSRDRVQTSQAGPLGSLLRFNPTSATSVRAEVTYNTLFGEIERTSFAGSFSLPKDNRVGVRWTTRTVAETGETRTNQVRLSTLIGLVPGRLTLASSVNYDFERSLFQLQRHILTYRGSCCTLALEAGDLRSGDRRDREFRFLVTLKGVGTFLDITGGESERF